MGIQNWSETIILINLATEPQMGEELQTAVDLVRRRCRDVVVDFSEVDIITSSSIAKLLKLRKALIDGNHRLVLSGMKARTRSIFTVTGLDVVFEFVEDQFLALAGLQMAGT